MREGWWHGYDDVLPPWFRVAVGLEESAILIRAYEPQVVPGLLQTEGYIRAITVASFPAATDDFTERTVALRLARQQPLGRPDPPECWVVLDETVLRRVPSTSATACPQPTPARTAGASRGATTAAPAWKPRNSPAAG